MKTDPIPFLFDNESLVRVVVRDEAPWFVAADACRVLGIKDTSDAVSRLEEDERGTAIAGTLGGPQELLVVSESGLYALIFRSRKPAAVRFRKWVTSEVLPSIRKTGRYEARPIEGELIAPPTEKRPFPDWPLEEMRTKRGVLDMYRMVYGVPSAQWVAPQLGFPTPPRELLLLGRQLDMFTQVEDEAA